MLTDSTIPLAQKTSWNYTARYLKHAVWIVVISEKTETRQFALLYQAEGNQ
jgi:hypothetical protein